MLFNIHRTRRARRAFTLIELLVVVAIIGILLALLLPAVQQARAAARRTQNRNHLKQIGLALHNYHDGFNVFPPGWIGITSGQPDVEGASGFGWASFLLPFVEQRTLEKQIDFNLPITDPANAAAIATTVPVYRNLADVSGVERFEILDEMTSMTVLAVLARANYVGNFGTTELEDCEGLMAGQQCGGNGIFFHNSRIRIHDVKDGTSQTFMVGERKTDAEQSPEWYSTWAGVVAGGEEAMTRVLGVADHTPNAPVLHFDDFSSYDPAGASFVLVDGSVRMVASQVSEEVYKALATRRGMEVGGEY